MSALSIALVAIVIAIVVGARGILCQVSHIIVEVVKAVIIHSQVIAASGISG